MIKKVLLMFLIFYCTISFAQQDSCIKIEYKNFQVYLLTDFNSINKDRIIGHIGKIIDLKELQQVKDFELNDIKNNIDEILIKNPDLHSVDYVIQVIPFYCNNSKYCEIIFQKKTSNNICLNTIVITQLGGGNSFCYFLFELNKNELIYTHCNGW